MKVVLSGLAFGLALTMGSSWADDAGKPVPHVGDRWDWQHVNAMVNEQDYTKIEDVIEVTEANFRTRIRKKGTPGNNFNTYTPDLNLVDNATERYSPALARFAFPLSVGKKWTAEFDKALLNNGKHGKFFMTGEVTSIEKVTVPAGTFDAYKVETRYEGQATDDDANRGITTEVHWYAPAVHNDVKITATFTKDGVVRTKDSYELLEYSLR